MHISIEGAPSFSHVHVDLDPGDSFVAESGAMQSMSAELTMQAVPNGGIVSALGKRMFGGESFFVSRFTNTTSRTLRVTIAQDIPGDIVEMPLHHGEEVVLQRGAYLGHAGDVQLKAAWAGFISWFSGEGLVHLRARSESTGTVYFGAYGAIIKRRIEEELKVDDGHLVAYDPALTLKVSLSGGLFASVFGGEGFVTRVIGTGDVYIQTRSVRGLAAWLNPKFR
ncbi:MAG TPA: TIGR00266 family protein [Alkalispirochaeta sp.]|nr:TIGR00266 family protein [Alkalispirochaeta sp.]